MDKVKIIDTKAKCNWLCGRNQKRNPIALYATGLPRQNVDVLLRLREELLKNGVPVILFFNNSAKPMLNTLLPMAGVRQEREGTYLEEIYQMDDLLFFQYLDFINILVTTDYANSYQLLKPESRILPQKIVLLQHAAKTGISCLNLYCDYLCSNTPLKIKWPFKNFPSQLKIHRTNYLTLLPCGYPKLDLLLEARQRNYEEGREPVFLFFIGDLFLTKSRVSLSSEEVFCRWKKIAADLLSEWPNGKVVFRPIGCNRGIFEELDLLGKYISTDTRLYLDLKDDNVWWLSRADYFFTDYSTAYVNWAYASLKPAIWLNYVCQPFASGPEAMECAPENIVDAVRIVQAEESQLRKKLLYKRRISYPFAGRTFGRLSAMLARINAGDDDSAWLRLEKEERDCGSLKDTLRFIGWFTSPKSPYLQELIWYVPLFLSLPCGGDCRVLLLLLKGALTRYASLFANQEMAVPLCADILKKCLTSCPAGWIRRVLRVCAKHNPALVQRICALCRSPEA